MLLLDATKALLLTALGYVFNVLIAVYPFVFIIMLLLIADMRTGIRAAKFAGRYEKNKKSSGWRRTIDKISSYSLVILLAEGIYLVFSAKAAYFPPLTYIVSLAIVYIEYESVNENIKEYTGSDIWAIIKDKIRLK